MLLLLAAAACTHSPPAHESPPADTGEVQDSVPLPDTGTYDTGYVPCDRPDNMVLELYRHESADGIVWDPPEELRSDISVPEIFSSPDIDDGATWMIWMAFEQQRDHCDRLVGAPFDPTTGEVGTEHNVRIRNTPDLTILKEGYAHPISDPDVLAGGRTPTMGNTIWPADESFPCVSIVPAISPGTLGDLLFDYQSQLLWCDADGVEAHTDPMAVWIPDDANDPDSPGEIRVWAASPLSMMDQWVANDEWVVAVPDPNDPSTWHEVDDRPAPMQFFHTLGSALYVGEPDCEWGMWGTRDNWIRHACTTDFEDWAEVGEVTLYSADPVVVRAEHGWMLFATRDANYTGEPDF